MSRRARQIARRILDQIGPNLPVDVKAIAEAYNITVRTEPLEDAVSGLLVVKDGHSTIGINELHPASRQRFTIAHELGHFLLHRTVSNVFIDAAPVFFRDEASSEGSLRQEIEANAFAAELLMPEQFLRQRLAHQPLDAFDEGAMRDLAAEFGVSLQALTIRLTRLGFITV